MKVALPLGTKIFLGTALVVVAVLSLALLLTKGRADRAADASAARALRATQSTIQDALERRTQSLRQLSSALVQVPAYVSRLAEGIRTGNHADLLDQADEIQSQTSADWVLITDNDGRLRAWTANRQSIGEDFSRGALFGRALEGQGTDGLWIEPGPEGDLLFQAVGVPLFDPGGRAQFGVLVAALRIDSTFAAELEQHTNSQIVFFSRDTLGVPQVAISTLLSTSLRPAVRELVIDTSMAGDSAMRLRISAGGEEWEGAAGLLRSADGFPLGGYLGLRSRDVELAAYRQLSRTIGWAFAGGLVLALASSYFVARQITQPVRRLVDVTRQVSEGQYTGDVRIRSGDEIGELADAFRTMLDELREKQQLVAYLSTGGARHPRGREDIDAGPDGMLTVGSRFAGRYDIEEVLGVGGMGVVYRAFDTEVGEVIAIKAILPELAGLDDTPLERFKQELRLARRITHRNIVRTYDLGEVGGIYYITMEYVEGRTLADLISTSERLPVAVTLTVGKQLCRALEAAHDEGVIHRDVKPQNVLVAPNGLVKVMDFGIARLAERRTPVGKGLTTVGVTVGTPQYMAPEQLMAEEIDRRADIYAAGAVLFECLTGRPVFEAPNLISLAARHLDQSPPDPRSLNEEVPEALASIVLKALAKQPEDRWQSAGDFLRALEQVPG